MKILDLVLTYQWYDMIDQGFKKEEYRRICPYWDKRLSKEYNAVRFHRGYTSTTMTFANDGITKGVGKEWLGAPKDEQVYIIKLGERFK